MRCRCKGRDVLPCDIDASEEFRGTSLGRSIEAAAFEIVLLEQSMTVGADLFEGDSDPGWDGWEPFLLDDLVSFTLSEDAEAIVSAVERMVGQGYLSRDEEGYLRVQPKLLEALVRYIQ